MFDGGVIITWGFGHLVELKLPKDYSNPINNWDLKTYLIVQVHLNTKYQKVKASNLTLLNLYLKTLTF